jgi:hypothetical protein
MKWVMFSVIIFELSLHFISFYFSFRTISRNYENKGLQSFFVYSLFAALTAIFVLGMVGYILKFHNSTIAWEVCRFALGLSFLPLYYILGRYALSVSNKLHSLFYKVLFWLSICSISFFIFLSAFDNNFYFRLITRVSLLVISVPYYASLAKSHPSQDLLKSFSFWIITGYTICMLGALPFDVYDIFFRVSSSSARYFLNTVVQIPYIIMYLFFIKAFLCIKKVKI